MNMAEPFFCTQIVTITKIFLVENHLKIRSYTQWSEESENAFNEQFSEYLKVNHGYPSELELHIYFLLLNYSQRLFD